MALGIFYLCVQVPTAVRDPNMFEHGLPCGLCHKQLDSVECLPTDLWQREQQPQPCGVEDSSWVRQLHSFIRDNDMYGGCH